MSEFVVTVIYVSVVKDMGRSVSVHHVFSELLLYCVGTVVCLFAIEDKVIIFHNFV
jgi:hypothetical protein